MSRHKIKYLKFGLGAVAVAANLVILPVQADMAQYPLLSATSPVEPNIVFMMDDSSSMPANAVYQYGGNEGVYGLSGPGNDVGTSCGSEDYHCMSPDVNLLYYDPRVSYKMRVNANGTPVTTYNDIGGNAKTFAVLPSTTEFKVYFYKPPATTTYSLKTGTSSIQVTNGGSGYASSGVTFKGPTPPAGGTQASGTVTTASSGRVTSVNVTSGGVYTSTSGVTVSFSGGGGSGATATPVFSTAASNGIRDFTAPTGTYPSSCRNQTVNVTFGSTGGGSGAAATATFNNNTSPTISSILITAGGSGYGSSTTVTISCGGTSRNGSGVTRGSVYRITGVTGLPSGNGYTSAPTVTFSAAGGKRQAAIGTAGVTNSVVVTSVNVVNGGSGYTSCPTSITLANTGGGSGATFNIPSSSCNSTTGGGGVNATWDGTTAVTTSGTLGTSSTFFNPSYTPDAGSPLAAGAVSTVYPNTAKSSVSYYPKFAGRTDCAGTRCTWNEELKNYSIWKAFHSNRLDVAKTGIGLAFQNLAVEDGQQAKFRLGWASINHLSGASGTTSGSKTKNNLDKGVRSYNESIRSEFFDWLYAWKSGDLIGGTPNRSALNKVGQYYLRTDDNGPWGTSPNGDNTIPTTTPTDSGSSNHASCRRSYAMLMTDGYYNDSFSMSGKSDWDSEDYTVPGTGYTYKAQGPYSDKKAGSGTPNTFGDVAMKYYLTDLRPGLANNLKPVTGDDAEWQHLNFYAIGLGVTGKKNFNDPAVLQAMTDPGRANSSADPSGDWEDPSTNSRTSIDDMWHATINGRGRLLSAKTANELRDSISQMMSDIGGKEGTQAGVAVSTASLTQGTKKYTPSYTPGTWEGNLVAYSLDSTNANQSGVVWQVETVISTSSSGEKTYASTIPEHDVRKIFVGNGAGTGTPRAVEFKHSTMGSTLLGQMGSPVEAMVNYLRGDATKEGTDYRKRSTRLGDVINSTPVFVKGGLDMLYDKLPGTVGGKATGSGSYDTFRAAKKARTEGVIFVGANDGMLHAFRDGTYDSSGGVISPGGAEVFAYVPYSLLPALTELANSPYTHRYFVDGPNVEADFYNGSTWRNVVIGSTGAGAGTEATPGTGPRSSVFAIDVTRLSSGSTGINNLGASDVLWEVGPWLGGEFLEMGHVLQDVQTGLTMGGDYVAIFGNGYESKSCGASLFVVKLNDGSLIRRIPAGTASCAAKNGLGGVRLVRDDQQRIIGAYAGDLQGDMWKFDLTSSSAASWSAGKLFDGDATRPITAPPSVLPLPIVGTTKPAAPGYMVLFGTGKFYESTDRTSGGSQRMYGIWDNLAFGAGVSTVTGISNLGTQTFGTKVVTTTTTDEDGNTTTTNKTYYTVTNNTISYDGAGAKRGWYLNLVSDSLERVIYPLELLAKRFVFVDAMSPAGVPTDPCSTEFGGVGYFYILDALNGGGPTEAVLDTDDSGNIDSGDAIVAGGQSKADGRNVSLLVSQTDLATKYANVSGGSPGSTLIQISCRLTNTCVVAGGAYQRQWRQLFMR